MHAGMTLLDFSCKEYDDSGQLPNREAGVLLGAALNPGRAADNWMLNRCFTWRVGDVLL